MPVPFQPLPNGKPMLDTKQFLFRLKHDPGFADKMRAHDEAMLAMPLNEDMAQIARIREASTTLFP